MEEVEVVISVICDMWSWAFDGRSVFNEDELGTRYLVCRSAWIRASENTLKSMVKTANHVLMLFISGKPNSGGHQVTMASSFCVIILTVLALRGKRHIDSMLLLLTCRSIFVCNLLSYF